MTRSQLIGRVAPIAAAILVAGTLVGVSSRTTPSPATGARGGPPAATATTPTPAAGTPTATAAATPPAAPPAATTADGTTPDGTTVVPPAGSCDPNYAGCVPLAADVDCAGEGDGPAHVTGPIQVIHEDHFGLDPDHNGTACDHEPPD
jgi:hypothetical protein